MRYLLILMLIFTAFRLDIKSQDKIQISNIHINDIDKRDLNQIYINKQIKKISKLDSSYFKSGLILKGNDTINCWIFLKRNTFQSDMYLYIIVKFDSSKVYYVLTAKDLDGYIINSQTFKSHCSNSNDIDSYSFIHLIYNGKIELYEREETAGNPDFVYLFKKRQSTSLSAITPFANNIRYYNETTSKDGVKYFSISTNHIDEKFKIAFKDYFSDCPDITGKIMSGFYTIMDFKKIILEYNTSCR